MPRGWKISKEKVSHKIDVVVALAMATLGAVQGGIARKPLRVTAAAVARARAMGRTPPIFFGPRSFYGAYPPR